MYCSEGCRINLLRRSIWLILAILLSACLPTSVLTPEPTQTSIPVPTTTPTVIWFPPTPTKTLIPTIGISPTPQKLPDKGQILLEDDFSDISSWIVGNPGNGTVAQGINEISLAIIKPDSYLYSYRNEPILSDFYAEITTSPSLCAGEDEYGILFRYKSPLDFYRFSLSCDGKIRLDKIFGGTASSPQPWLESISVPNVAPSSSRLGIWIDGSEMRFYINEELQFNVTDRSIDNGLIGVFARSAAENAVTVSFSDLVIYQLIPE